MSKSSRKCIFFVRNFVSVNMKVKATRASRRFIDIRILNNLNEECAYSQITMLRALFQLCFRMARMTTDDTDDAVSFHFEFR